MTRMLAAALAFAAGAALAEPTAPDALVKDVMLDIQRIDLSLHRREARSALSVCSRRSTSRSSAAFAAASSAVRRATRPSSPACSPRC